MSFQFAAISSANSTNSKPWLTANVKEARNVNSLVQHLRRREARLMETISELEQRVKDAEQEAAEIYARFSMIKDDIRAALDDDESNHWHLNKALDR